MEREVKLFYEDSAKSGDTEWVAVVRIDTDGDIWGCGATPAEALEDLRKTLAGL